MGTPALDISEQHPSRKIYSVSELTRDIKRILEDRYPLIWVSGELSNLRIPSSGHAYFSLKDKNAQISAVMFRGQLRHLKFDIDDGMSVLAMGRISVYEPRGSYQMIIEYAEPKGVGALQLAFEQLRDKLSAEGLFDETRKRPLPFLPSRPGIITSPTGAVIQDILNVCSRRFSNLAMDLYPVAVQGEPAADEIANAIALANRRKINDVLIIARGGGSLEDLAAFNSEVVARAISGSGIPIVSAVGHETDYTIADFVADLRAPTPSAAAELTVPLKNELKARLFELKKRCWRAVQQRLDRMRQQTVLLTRSLVHPGKGVEDARIHLDQLTQSLVRSMRDGVERRKIICQRLHATMDHRNPLSSVQQYRYRVQMMQFKIRQSILGTFNKYRERTATADALLNALNPDAILQRGYSITRTLPGRRVAMDADSIKPGQLLEIQLANGHLQALAQKKNDDRQEE